jgi:hypothetical protein
VRFLASVEAGQAWRRSHPQALLLSIAQGFALGQAVNRLRLGLALPQDAGAPVAAPLAEPERLP